MKVVSQNNHLLNIRKVYAILIVRNRSRSNTQYLTELPLSHSIILSQFSNKFPNMSQSITPFHIFKHYNFSIVLSLKILGKE